MKTILIVLALLSMVGLEDAQDNGGGGPVVCNVCGNLHALGCCADGPNGGTSCSETLSPILGQWICVSWFRCYYFEGCDTCQVYGECHVVPS